MKKNLDFKRIAFFLVVGLIFSSSAFLLIKKSYWHEMSERDAKRLALPIPSWAPLVERVQPAVIVITTEAVIEQQPLEFPGIPGPFRFFVPQPPEKQRGQGSGFIINENGYALTNQHVIEGAQKIRVKVGKDPTDYKAKVVGEDKELDIALIKLVEASDEESKKNSQKKKWPFLPLGDSDKLRLGDWVMALGSPLGLVQSVNVGIVSEKHRGGIRPSGRDLYAELMQLQMPINPGNSGGPVVDVSGRVVGVSESILASGQSIAFCVPIDIVKSMIPQLMQNGKIEKAFLGVEPTDLTPQYAKALGLSQRESGAVVVQVMPNTPAMKAGLKPMDVILEFDGKNVKDSFNLRQQTAYGGVGKDVSLKVFRKGVGTFIKKIKLEERPGQEVLASTRGSRKVEKIIIESVGLELVNTPESLIKDLNLDKNKPGAQIVGVSPRSPASFVGLEPNDVITKINDTWIKSAVHAKKIIEAAKPESTLLLLTRRGKAERFVPLSKN